MPVPSPQFDLNLLQQLACPVCFGTLQPASSAGQIECVGCNRLYPIIDGIPVLILERAVRRPTKA